MTATVQDSRLLREQRTLYRASQILQRRWEERLEHPDINAPALAKDYFRALLAGRDREAFVVACLDTKHRLLCVETLHTGTIDTCDVYPREVARLALHNNAAAVMVAHNHPSGDPTPSEMDLRLTATLIEALKLLDIRLVDHVVVGDGGAVSIMELGRFRGARVETAEDIARRERVRQKQARQSEGAKKAWARRRAAAAAKAPQ